MSNSGVKMLKGLQFGMLDEDNDGEVSLSDISRAVFRRAGDRDRSRIRKFLEVQSLSFVTTAFKFYLSIYCMYVRSI